jgi:hypothetical protein
MSKSGQSFLERHSTEQSGTCGMHVPVPSQYIAISTQGRSGGQVLHDAPHSLPAQGSTPAPETPPLLGEPPLLVPPPETPPLEKPPFAEPPLDIPPAALSPASPATDSPSPSVSVDWPPHAPATTTNNRASAAPCLITPTV